MVLELKRVVETSQIRVRYHCISRSFHFNSYLKQLYISNKMKHFSYKSGYGMMALRYLKEELPWAIDQHGLGLLAI